MPYASDHSKTVNRAIASLALDSALKKSCVQVIPEGFDAQLKKLQSVGYLSFVLVGVAEALLRKAKGHVRQNPPDQSKAKPVVLPYIQRVTHNLKKVAERYRGPVVFSAPRKLGRLCVQISGKPKGKKCEKKHAKRFVRCDVGVVYEIPLSCGEAYIGQTDRCVNDRAREYNSSRNNDTRAHLPAHCER